MDPPPSGMSSHRSGIVTIVDDESKTFRCYGRRRGWTFKTTDETDFRIGKQKAAFSDLTVGEMVFVTYHAIDKAWVAEKVVITTP